MTKAQELELRRSEVRQRLNEISGLEGDDFTDEVRAEAEKLTTEFRDIEVRWRVATVTEADEVEKRKAEAAASPDRETRERLELRSKASLGRYLKAALRGGLVQGAEAELMDAAGIEDGIPLELWDTTTPEERAVTDAPGTVGVNLDRIRPHVFAPSILPRLGVEMPRVMSGTYASATIASATAADAVAKSADAPATAATFTVTTATPKRVSARLELTLEDIAAVGQANFESALRENLSMALSAELDDQGLNGDGTNDDLRGLFLRLTDPSDPTDVATFDAFAGAHAGGIDGLWASTLKDVGIVVNPDTMKLAARTFQSATNYKGEMSAAAYAMERTGGFWTNNRMPATASTIAQAILYRMGRSGMRTAVCPHWGRIGVDDVYSGSGKGERYFTLHVLLGDVIVVQPGAYSQVAFKVA
ncbi:MAG: phage major capsid protein [Gemmatimonadetes bacterium]|nr:phage major capsid protein [Gemmatimonadota bacterium]